MLFAMLDPRLERLLADARQEAVNLLALWVIEDDCGTLREPAARLQGAVTRLIEAVPAPLMRGSNLGRHIHFLAYYLERNRKDACTSDIHDIAANDLPELEREVRAAAAQMWPVDAELRDRTVELLEAGHHVDAVRNAFVLLTERLRSVKRGVRERDGHALVEELFGDDRRLAAYMTDGPRRGMRHLLLGLYTHFRNPYAHRRVGSTAAEATGLVIVIDRLLGDIARIKRLRRRRVARPT